MTEELAAESTELDELVADELMTDSDFRAEEENE